MRGLQLIESLSKVYYEEEGKEARKQFHSRMSKGMDCCPCENNGHDEKTKNKEREEYISDGLPFIVGREYRVALLCQLAVLGEEAVRQDQVFDGYGAGRCGVFRMKAKEKGCSAREIS